MSNYNYEELTNTACDNIQLIFDRLGVEYKTYGKRLAGKCPIHMGDNNTAWNFYPYGYNVRGYWSCYTHNCEEKWGKDLIGCLRGIISAKSGKVYSRQHVVNWLCKVLNYELKEISPLEKDKNNYSAFINVLSEDDGCDTHLEREIFKNYQESLPPKIEWTRQEVQEILQIPAKYYIQRGYSPEILKKYDIGFHAQYNRVMVPIFSANDYPNKVYGFVGRSIYKQCDLCKLYHPENQCPRDETSRQYAVKWRTNKGLYTSNHLFNLWFAKDYIQKSGTVILVEGVGDVLRLEEAGINNAVSLFGVHLYPKQLQLLQQLNIQKVISILDNDKAGKYGNELIREKLGKIYYLEFPNLSKKDIGEMSLEEIRSLNLHAYN